MFSVKLRVNRLRSSLAPIHRFPVCCAFEEEPATSRMQKTLRFLSPSPNSRPLWDATERAYRNLDRILQSLEVLERFANRYGQQPPEPSLYKSVTDLLAGRLFELQVRCQAVKLDAQFSFTLSSWARGLSFQETTKEREEELLSLFQEAEDQIRFLGDRIRVRPYYQELSLNELTDRTKRNAMERSFARGETPPNVILPGYEPLGPVPSSIPKTFLRFLQGLSPAYEEAAVERYRLGRYQFLASARAALGLTVAPILASEIGKRWLYYPLIRYAWNSYHPTAFLSDAQQRSAIHELQGFEQALYFEEMLSHLANAEIFIGDRARELQIPGHQERILHQRMMEVLERYNADSISCLVTLAGDLTFFVGIVVALIRLRYEIIILRGVLTELFFALDDPLKCFLLYYGAELLVGYHSKNGWDVGLRAAMRRIGLEENEQVVKLAIATVPVMIDTLFKYWVFRHLNRLSPTTTATYYQLIESRVYEGSPMVNHGRGLHICPCAFHLTLNLINAGRSEHFI